MAQFTPTTSTKKKIAITILSVVTIVGGTLFFIKYSTNAATIALRNSQVRFAEIPVGPFATSTATMKIPILVYHIVRPSYPTDSAAVKALAQTPEIFDSEMAYLGTAGYHVIPFSALDDSVTHGTTLPSNPIVLSFDDGWSDQFTYAFPILQKYHYTATFFIFTNPIGTRGFMTWDDLRALRDAGMSIGDHTRTHPFLTKITDPKQLWNEINGSKQTLEKNLGITVHEFAYPFGQYNATIIALLKEAGYRAARGDYVSKNATTSASQLFTLSALNAPTNMPLFKATFPIK